MSRLLPDDQNAGHFGGLPDMEEDDVLPYGWFNLDPGQAIHG